MPGSSRSKIFVIEIVCFCLFRCHCWDYQEQQGPACVPLVGTRNRHSGTGTTTRTDRMHSDHLPETLLESKSHVGSHHVQRRSPRQ